MRELSYRGYATDVEYDADEAIFFGRIAGLADGVGFHAETAGKLEIAFHDAVDDYLATCIKLGKTPETPIGPTTED